MSVNTLRFQTNSWMYYKTSLSYKKIMLNIVKNKQTKKIIFQYTDESGMSAERWQKMEGWTDGGRCPDICPNSFSVD